VGIVRRLTEKPWLAPGLDPLAEPDAEGLQSLPAAAVGLRVYFGVATVMFALIALLMVARMGGHGLGTEQQPDWKPMVWPPLLWVNTGVLILSSAAWEWARAAAHRGQLESLRAGLIAGGVLALAFLAGQLLGGLAVWGRTTGKVLGGSEVAEVRQSVELCTIYWHFLLLVWLVMLGLLLLNRR